METTKDKIFKDPVHGYINVPTCYVKNIIDSEFFQRLRNIEQTGMRVLYPTGKHDRFSHSVGVFYLGQKAVDALKKDLWNQDFKEEDARCEVLFLAACLLHDIGHTPFSHSLEEQILTNSIMTEHVKRKRKANDKKKTINQLLIERINENESKYCEEKEITREPIDEIKAAPHEQLGSYLIFEKFADNIRSLEEAYGIWKNEVTLNDDICFIVRMVMGIKYREWASDRQVRNCFIELLNGDNFDVDKLDYIVRDTQMSGINNVSVDVERLLGSLCVVKKTKHINKVNLSKKDIKNLTISEISNEDGGNDFTIDGEFKGAIKIFSKAEIKMGVGSTIEMFKGADQELAEIAYMSGDHAVFSPSTKLKFDNEWINEDEKTGFEGKVKELIGRPNKAAFNTYFEKATLLSDLKIKAKKDLEIYICGPCKLTLKGKFESKGALKLFSLKELNGAISNVEILGDTFKEDFTCVKDQSEHGYNTYSIGFKKQAINVIANVLEARNYLYLWVYAHHKVIYYANFLIPVISKQIADYCGKDDRFPSWKLDYNNLGKLDDYYIWTAMKYIRDQSSKFKLKTEYIDLIDQLFSRKYNKSLYKSLAEFELVFDSFTAELKESALNKLKAQTDSAKPFLGETKSKNFNSGYIKPDGVRRINALIKENIQNGGCSPENLNIELTEVSYVVTEFKQKMLNPNKVYLDMGDEILPISQIPLLFEPHIANKGAKENYFYIYYKDNEEGNSPFKTRFIKEAIKKWLLESKKDNQPRGLVEDAK